MNHNKNFNSRIYTLLIVAMGFFILIIGQLINVQVVKASNYSNRALNELQRTSVQLAPRGEITDINGVQLARSVAAETIVVDQTEIADPALAAQITSPVLGMSVSELTALYTGKLLYKKILVNASPATWLNLQQTITDYNKKVMKEKGGIAKRIVGFFSERSYVRDYPTGKLASSLIGFINDAGAGASGIESSMNQTLNGVNGEYVFENGAGNIIPGSAKTKIQAKVGTSVKLTIDRDIQWVAQDAISTAVKNSHAKSGTVIVMDPKTGAILAQASAPTFDPADKKTITLNSIRNPAVQDIYDPGSTGKVITVAAALEEHKTTPTSVFTIPYQLKVGSQTYHDHERHATERLTTTGLLAVSSNTGAIQVGQSLGAQSLHDYLTKFGIGQNTGSHLPGESAGLLLPLDKWSDSTLPTNSFGQGYSVTALQATSVFATIANDGVRVPPTVVAGTTDASGNFSPAKQGGSQRVISAATAQELRGMLESVVSENGTAPSAAIPGYRVAGKTGTAQRFNESCKCYAGYTASFIGFAPADAPKYVVNVTIQDPIGLHWGGALGGPVFKKVMSFTLQNKGIAPTAGTLETYPLSEKDLNKVSVKPIKPVKQ
jgi:cell division protein FtsI (penicillin-binding protein 3)